MQNVHDAYVDSRFDPFWDRKNGYRTHSILCAPIRTIEDPDVRYGCVQLINKKGMDGSFDGAPPPPPPPAPTIASSICWYK